MKDSADLAVRLPSEVVMFQVGGMGDVVTALGRAVQEEGHRVEVILPKYDCIRYDDVSSSLLSLTAHCTTRLQTRM